MKTPKLTPQIRTFTADADCPSDLIINQWLKAESEEEPNFKLINIYDTTFRGNDPYPKIRTTITYYV